MTYVPRDYQIQAVDAVFRELETVRSTMFVHATGAGKTWVLLKIVERFLRQNPDLAVLYVAHREELIYQPAHRWWIDQEERPAIEMGAMRCDYDDVGELFNGATLNRRFVIASIQTLNSGKRCTNCTADCGNCEASGKLLVDCRCRGDGCEECRGSGKRKIKCKECDGDGWICTEDDCAVCFEHFTRRFQRFQPEDFGLLIYDECFPAGTIVDGKRIEDIMEGDVVTSFSAASGETVQRRVTRTFRKPAPTEMVRIRAGGRSVSATLNHPFLTDGGWVNAGNIKAGDIVRGLFRGVLCLERVDSVEILKRSRYGEPDAVCPDGYVYNLEVEGEHTYIANGFAVHNCHHSVAGSYTRLIRYMRHRNQSIRIMGCTATPDRADEEALGQVFETVAHEYSLPQPIHDGWLTPIDQRFIVIDDLNLSNVRTTAGDLNSGDLEREMLAEKVLHKVTTPLVEIACGVEAGTIDGLVKVNELHRLEGLCGKREPTLVHCVDVAHAERTTEILNRYLPGSALCIIGTTPKDIRRDGLKKFADGKFQFLLSCGVFLEGTDLPNVSIVAMARPTKSRSLYSQMLGRGLRPLPGLVDGVETAEERVQLIATSEKKKCTVIDFVGNSGRHKLICSADILGAAMPDDLVDRVIRKLAKENQPVDVLRALMIAQEQAEATRRNLAREEAAKRADAQEAAKRRAAERRAGIVAGVTYSSQRVNPFDVFDVAPTREPGWHKGRKPTDKMKEVLTNAKVPFTDETTFWEAHLLIDELMRRRREGKCTFKQAKWLQEHGYSADLSFPECQRIMDAWAKNGWKRPEGST